MTRKTANRLSNIADTGLFLFIFVGIILAFFASFENALDCRLTNNDGKYGNDWAYYDGDLGRDLTATEFLDRYEDLD